MIIQEEEEELICEEDDKSVPKKRLLGQIDSENSESFDNGSVVFYQDNEEFDFKQWFKH